VTAIAAGGYQTVVLKSDGTVWDWGSNSNGQLGNNSTVDSHVPVQVPGLSQVAAIAAGGNHTLALKVDGTVWAWGLNQFGQLGNNSTVDSHVPVQVSGLSGVTAIDGGDSHTVALVGPASPTISTMVSSTTISVGQTVSDMATLTGAFNP